MHDHNNKNNLWMMILMMICCLTPLLIIFAIARGVSSWWAIGMVFVLIGFHIFMMRKKNHKCAHENDLENHQKADSEHGSCH